MFSAYNPHDKIQYTPSTNANNAKLCERFLVTVKPDPPQPPVLLRLGRFKRLMYCRGSHGIARSTGSSTLSTAEGQSLSNQWPYSVRLGSPQALSDAVYRLEHTLPIKHGLLQKNQTYPRSWYCTQGVFSLLPIVRRRPCVCPPVYMSTLP